MAGHGSRGRALRNKRDGEVRGVHLRTKRGWRRSTGTRSRDVGSQVRNDRRLRCPSLLLNGIGCADAPGWRPLDGVDLVRRSAAGKAQPVSPLILGVAATGSSLTSLSGWTRCPLSGHPCFHVLRGPTCVLAVNLRFEVLPIWLRITTSCSPGVSWTDADLRHMSRCQPPYHSLRRQSCPLVRGAHREPGLLACRTVRLEAPAGVSFRPEPPSMPGKG